MADQGLTLFDLQPGKVIKERFEIVRSLRHAGMSQTFEVRDRTDGAERELIVFPAALFEDQAQSQEFAAAMGAWRAVEARAVVRLRDILRLADGALLLCTDLSPGVSLRSWLNEHGRMSVEQACRLCHELLDGLAAVHGLGLVHGDIKPYAIHVDADASPESALLLDGGITPGLWSAKHLGDRTVLIGTPFYAPLEQFGGESPDVQSDLYNLSTVLYELVAGTVPWAGQNFLEVFQAKLLPPPTVQSRAKGLKVPEALEALVRRGLQPHRHERYQSAAEFQAALARVLG